MRSTIALSFAGVLLAGTALAQGNPGTRAGGIYSATPGNTGMTGPGYGPTPRPTEGSLGYGAGSALTGTGITPEGPAAGSGPNTSVSYGSGLGAALSTGGMPQPLVKSPPRLPKLKNPAALDAYNQSEPSVQQRGPNGEVIQPGRPAPTIGENATADQYLRLAQSNLQARRNLEAMVALEYAETRLLNRSAPYGAPANADETPSVRQIAAARSAIGNHDVATAQQILAQLLANPPGSPPNSPPPASPRGGM